MKCIIAIAFAVILVVAEGRPDGAETQQASTVQPMQLNDYIKQAQTQITNLGTQLQEQLSLPNQQELVNTLKEQSNTLAENVRSYINTMSDEIKNKRPELENLWTNVQTKLSEMANNLNTNPETTEQLNQLKEKFTQGLHTIMSESENVAKNINENSAKVQEGIAELTKQAVDLAVQASQNLNNQLKQATTPKNA